MFTGIVEVLGKVKALQRERENLVIKVSTRLAQDLKIDQSVSHNGVCLTVVEIGEEWYTVVAVQETLQKTMLCDLKDGDFLNLERAMQLGDRLDGHLVQGHVDQTGICTNIDKRDGSWLFRFQYDNSTGNFVVEKGSITINGVSLTVINSTSNAFEVAIIPYTFEHTTFKFLRIRDRVNIEFDIIGKYVQQLTSAYR